jgi:hypothetical protein
MQGIEREMAKIVELAEMLGDPVREEARRLQNDVSAYLKDPSDKRIESILKKHALRLEQETREI